MMKTRLNVLLALAALVAVSIGGTTANALTFTVHEILSNLTLTGTVDLGSGPIPFSEQIPGSSTSAYTGTIEVAVDDVLAPSTISITSASLVAGDFPGGSLLPAPGGGPAAGDPGTPAAANYGIALDTGLGVAYAAVRDLVWDLSSPTEAVIGGKFSSLSQTLAATAGTFDVNLPAFLGSPPTSDPIETIVLNTAAASTYSVGGTTAVLIIPFLAKVPGGLTIEYAGTIIATATVPEPTSCLLVGIGLVAIAGFSRRKM